MLIARYVIIRPETVNLSRFSGNIIINAKNKTESHDERKNDINSTDDCLIMAPIIKYITLDGDTIPQ